MNFHVLVSKGKDPYLTARNALQRFPFPALDGKRVLIKPNAARLASPGNGITTHPLVVAATIDHLRERGVKDITMGESCIFGVDPQEAFERTGMEEISQKKEVRLLDLDQETPLEMTIRGGTVLSKIKVSSLINKMDLIISIPVMKTHMHTQVTLSIKNMKGLLWRKEKVRLHQLVPNKKVRKGYKSLDVAISEMATVLTPHFTIVDGTTGMEGMGPAYGKPKKMGIVLVSDNALSADAVAARLMGFDPEEIPHLKLSFEKGLGEIRLEKISIEPSDFLKWENPFERSPSQFSIPFPDVMVHDEGSCSACLSTLILFLNEYYSQLGDYYLGDQKLHIGIGKHLKACPKGTIFIGNCTSKMKGKGFFVSGCPPVSSHIINTLRGATG